MGMRKTWFSRQRLFVQIWFGIFAIIIGAGIYFGNITFTFGSSSAPSYSPKTIIKNLSGVKNITGTLFITPFGSYEKLANILSQTHKSLKLQTYDFTEKRIKKLFSQLLASGTHIQLIMENKKFQQYQNTFKQVQNYFSGYSNFEIKSDQQMGTEYVHSKINIVDSGRIIQTANLTHSSLFENREHFFAGTDSGILAGLTTVFDKDRKGEKILLKDIHPNLLVCNINCRTVIEYYLKNANSSIIIQTQYISDPAIIEILKSKKNLGQKLLVADTEQTDKTVGAKKLKKPYNHTKMILIDKKILILGSMNLSANSLDKNREIWIIIIDPAIIKQFLNQFEKDWTFGR